MNILPLFIRRGKMDLGQRGRRGGRGRGFGGGFRRDGGFDDNRNRSDSSNWRSQNSDGVSSSENETTKMYVEENCVGRIIGKRVLSSYPFSFFQTSFNSFMIIDNGKNKKSLHQHNFR